MNQLQVQPEGTLPSRGDVAAFYDRHSEKLLRDFVNGNRRVTAAIELVLSTMTGQERNVLDVGCGIGTAAKAYVERYPSVDVLGVDISPKNIQTATRLFAMERLHFMLSDMTAPPPGGPFDVVALLDVYEHIARVDWPRFNQILSDCLSPTGVLVMTTPSPLHQEYLRVNAPEGLQVIDETVFLDDIEQLGRHIGASLTYYRLVTVWATNQYLHVVFKRAPIYAPVKAASDRPLSFIRRCGRKLRAAARLGRRLSDHESRRDFVRHRLNVDIK